MLKATVSHFRRVNFLICELHPMKWSLKKKMGKKEKIFIISPFLKELRSNKYWKYVRYVYLCKRSRIFVLITTVSLGAQAGP